MIWTCSPFRGVLGEDAVSSWIGWVIHGDEIQLLAFPCFFGGMPEAGPSIASRKYWSSCSLGVRRDPLRSRAYSSFKHCDFAPARQIALEADEFVGFA